MVPSKAARPALAELTAAGQRERAVAVSAFSERLEPQSSEHGADSCFGTAAVSATLVLPSSVVGAAHAAVPQRSDDGGGGGGGGVGVGASRCGATRRCGEDAPGAPRGSLQKVHATHLHSAQWSAAYAAVHQSSQCVSASTHAPRRRPSRHASPGSSPEPHPVHEAHLHQAQWPA
eukprot:CAMPEP_0183344696 /NCGR_PEP_ID=MMETSP0164_2-20130417/10307_1 /TAXON_ID=221442 /ORGANISM="Coccolithus pelagicus ssp braarudi, Strain PLY182g" /LENGTH=174 /DNA_ID=CAMNT_0025515733 /DNA_START=316 /DNA_END=841 /DNA_ORIENTATION=+